MLVQTDWEGVQLPLPALHSQTSQEASNLLHEYTNSANILIINIKWYQIKDILHDKDNIQLRIKFGVPISLHNWLVLFTTDFSISSIKYRDKSRKAASLAKINLYKGEIYRNSRSKLQSCYRTTTLKNVSLHQRKTAH